MNPVEIIGLVATLVLVISQIHRNVLILRAINILGSAIFVVYAALLPAWSTLALNAIMIVINTWQVIRLLRLNKDKVKENKNDK